MDPAVAAVAVGAVGAAVPVGAAAVDPVTAVPVGAGIHRKNRSLKKVRGISG